MPLDTWVRSHTRERQFALAILSVFAILAMAIGVVGVYGSVSYAVAQRRREFGIRLALGASPHGIRRMLLGDAARLLLTGTAAGTLVAGAATPLTRHLLFGVSALDPFVFAGVPALLIAAGVLACWWSARTTSRLELSGVLRTE
jgi:putative ABC transport system permease protein